MEASTSREAAGCGREGGEAAAQERGGLAAFGRSLRRRRRSPERLGSLPASKTVLAERRTALFLYAFLVVLPTLVLAGLHWYQLEQDHRQRLAVLPENARDASRRLAEALRQRVELLIEGENRRPFFHYRPSYQPPGEVDELVLVGSPLSGGPWPAGILGWFTYDLRRGPQSEVELFGGDARGGRDWEELAPELARAAAEVVRHDWNDGEFRRIARYGPGYREVELQLPLAAINTSRERDEDRLRAELPALLELAEETLRLHTYDFHLRFYHDAEGAPRLLATRLLLFAPSRALGEMPDCYSRLAFGASIIQGFFLDPRWVFEDLPRSLALQMLDASQRFLPMDSPELAGAGDETVHPLFLVRELGIETYDAADGHYGTVGVVTDSRGLRLLLGQQSWRFFGVASMMMVSLTLGLVLLFRSVRRDLEQAQRTENFVAAVSHELRTPVSAIRLYGEMLRDGWAPDPDRQAQYHERIVSECQRLETLIERVLEKSRLESEEAVPGSHDLSRVVEPIARRLSQGAPLGGVSDLAVELSSDLPPAMLTPEGVATILVNLVENARKYAPSRRALAPEPILVRTRLLDGHPVLEVLDRGPGIPEEERDRVFEAFYRIGNEATRTSRGTGLGLHLVRLQALAMGGRATVHPRPGGGSIFRVTFREAAAS